MSLENNISGQFSKGIKCNLSQVKTATIGQTLMTILFFSTTEEKFIGRYISTHLHLINKTLSLSVVSPSLENKKLHDTMEDGKSYFVKNVVKKIIEGVVNLFEATNDSTITKAKRQLTSVQKYD